MDWEGWIIKKFLPFLNTRFISAIAGKGHCHINFNRSRVYSVGVPEIVLKKTQVLTVPIAYSWLVESIFGSWGDMLRRIKWLILPCTIY